MGGIGLSKAEIKAVIYDFDGVIVDSREANAAYYNRLLKHFGLPAVRSGTVGGYSDQNFAGGH